FEFHGGHALMSEPVCCRLCAGGKGIRTCYGAFPVKSFFLVCCRFFVRSGKAVPRPVACNQVRGARGRVKGPKREQSLAACRLAGLVFGSALTPKHAEGG